MRDLKFRAWDKATNTMIVAGFYVFGEYTLFNLIGQYLSENFVGDKSTLERYSDVEIMQFTGLLDKNGKEVYEGDILLDEYDDKYEPGGKVGIYYPVVFMDGCLGWIGENSGEFYNFHDYPVPETVIVGNIYENGDLLKEKEEEIEEEFEEDFTDPTPDDPISFLNWVTSQGWARLPGNPPRYFLAEPERKEASAEEVYEIFQNKNNLL